MSHRLPDVRCRIRYVVSTAVALVLIVSVGACGGGGGENDAGLSSNTSTSPRDASETRDAGSTADTFETGGPECITGAGCESGVCREGLCVAPTCSDGVENGNETDVDCGGDCEPCDVGETCRKKSDCASGVCQSSEEDGETVCAEPSCSDGVENGDEFGVDCGGPCEAGCSKGSDCSEDSDCASGRCENDTCQAASCSDDVTNGEETDNDCGGSECRGCAVGLDCKGNDDCQSGVCDGGTCVAPNCMDGVTNGLETDVDCGGPNCNACSKGESCLQGSDCVSRACTDGTCTEATCSDGVENGEETDTDCGGPNCKGCASDESCRKDRDCESGVCDEQTCRAPTCSDEVSNGKETDVDCGGPNCDPCANGKSCSKKRDCQSNICRSGTCRVRPCRDGTKNNGETDVDCGGPTCSACTPGKSCNKDSDCTTNDCLNGTCAECRNLGETRTTSCGYKDRGTVTETCKNYAWVPQNKCQGVWYGSCREIHDDKPNATSGQYTIDPDGPNNQRFSSFSVRCDMSYKGGGWTIVTPCMAKNELEGTVSRIDRAPNDGFNQCRPFTQDARGDHHYVYDFKFPAGFQEFYLDQYEIKANSGGFSDTTEVRPKNSYGTWSPNSSTPNDVGFGSSAFPGPTTSFGQQWASKQECENCTFQWPAGRTVFGLRASSTVFRIGWAESGSQDEGWYPWWKGTIRLR